MFGSHIGGFREAKDNKSKDKKDGILDYAAKGTVIGATTLGTLGAGLNALVGYSAVSPLADEAVRLGHMGRGGARVAKGLTAGIHGTLGGVVGGIKGGVVGALGGGLYGLAKRAMDNSSVRKKEGSLPNHLNPSSISSSPFALNPQAHQAVSDDPMAIMWAQVNSHRSPR